MAGGRYETGERFMFELFSDIFTSRDSALGRIDTRVKLTLSLVMICGVLLSSTVYFPLLVLSFTLVTISVVRIPYKIILARLILPLGIVMVIVALKTIMAGSTEIFTVSWAGLKITAYSEGLSEGVLIGVRVLAAVSVTMLLSFVSPAPEIFRALKWFRLPRDLIEIAALMYRYTFILIEQISEVAVAQRVRLGYAGMKRTFSSAGILAGTVVVRSIDQSMQTHEAMVTRCYDGHMPLGPMPRMKSSDWLVFIIFLFFMAGLYFLLEIGGL